MWDSHKCPSTVMWDSHTRSSTMMWDSHKCPSTLMWDSHTCPSTVMWDSHKCPVCFKTTLYFILRQWDFTCYTTTGDLNIITTSLQSQSQTRFTAMPNLAATGLGHWTWIIGYAMWWRKCSQFWLSAVYLIQKFICKVSRNVHILFHSFLISFLITSEFYYFDLD